MKNVSIPQPINEGYSQPVLTNVRHKPVEKGLQLTRSGEVARNFAINAGYTILTLAGVTAVTAAAIYGVSHEHESDNTRPTNPAVFDQNKNAVERGAQTLDGSRDDSLGQAVPNIDPTAVSLPSEQQVVVSPIEK